MISDNTRIIDLRQDREAVEEALEAAIRKFAREYPNHSASALVLWYTAAGGRVTINIDAGEDYIADGEFTHFAYATIEFPSWADAYENIDEKPFTLITHDGEELSSEDMVDEEDYEPPFGNMLVDVLLSARENGLFEHLPRNPGCIIAVEESETGFYEWPDPAEDNPDNRID